MDENLLKFKCSDESKALRAVGDVLSHLSGETYSKIKAIHLHYLASRDYAGLYALINDKTVGEVLSEWKPRESLQPILSGQRDGLSFTLYETPPDVELDTKGTWTSLFDCKVAHSGAMFDVDVTKRLQQLGIVFYKDDDYPASIVGDPAQQIIDDDSTIIMFAISHACFSSSERGAAEIHKRPPWYMNGKLPRSFRISSTNLRNRPENADVIQELALGHAAFLRMAIPEFKPTLALVDQCCLSGGLKAPVIEARKLSRLYWMTYFGPEYVAAHGLDFWMNIPAWRTEEYDGGVLVTVTERYLDFATKEPVESLAYLRHTFPQIIANRFVP